MTKTSNVPDVQEPLNLEPIQKSLLDGSIKGIPGDTEEFRLADIGRRKWNVLRQDLSFPLAVVKDRIVSSNSQWMRCFLRDTGTSICPHGKTTMSPQLFQIQLDDGAWGITAATVNQVQVYRKFGVQRILLANQLVGKSNIRYIIGELQSDPTFDFYCLLDSLDGLQLLTRELPEAIRQPLQVFVEVGQPGGRTGCRTVEEAVTLAEAVASVGPAITLRGVEGFEGVLGGATIEQTEAKVKQLLDQMVEVALICERDGLFSDREILLSAGGSAFFDLAARCMTAAPLNCPFRVVLRSGCYLTHDSQSYEALYRHLVRRSSDLTNTDRGLQPALEVWGCIQSRPEQRLALATLGKRDVSFDMGLPVPTVWYRPGEAGDPVKISDDHRVRRLDDQHAYLEIPSNSPLQVGDLVGFGISHPCTTFDKWKVLFVVNDRYDVVSAIRTFF